MNLDCNLQLQLNIIIVQKFNVSQVLVLSYSY